MLRCNGQRLPQRQQERRLPGGAVLPEPQGEAGDAGAGERDLGGVSAVGEANGDTIDLISEQKLGGVSALTDGLQMRASRADRAPFPLAVCPAWGRWVPLTEATRPPEMEKETVQLTTGAPS